MKIKSRYFARKRAISEIRRVIAKTSLQYAGLIQDNSRVEIVDTDKDITIILVNGKQAIMKVAGKYFPTVKGALRMDVDRNYVTVDKGGVEFIIKGADVMRPGVVDYDRGIKKGDFVIIIEESHRKPLAIGIALWDRKEFTERKTGKCVRTIHHVGDEIWGVE